MNIEDLTEEQLREIINSIKMHYKGIKSDIRHKSSCKNIDEMEDHEILKLILENDTDGRPLLAAVLKSYVTTNFGITI